MMLALALAVSATSPLNDLATIMFCGSTDYPSALCCDAAKSARTKADAEGRRLRSPRVAEDLLPRQ
jgi:hypothetical protein